MDNFATRFAKRIEVEFAHEDALDTGEYAKYRVPYLFSVKPGRRFDKIAYTNGTQTFVYAFVERATGKLIKAAGWKSPAYYSDGSVASRYDLSTPAGFDKATAEAQRHGGQLYAR